MVALSRPVKNTLSFCLLRNSPIIFLGTGEHFDEHLGKTLLKSSSTSSSSTSSSSSSSSSSSN